MLACWRVGVLVLGCWGRADLRLPASSGAEEARRDGQEPQEGKDLSLDQYPPLTEQLAPELITFSTVPAPRWQASASLPSSSRICLLALVLAYLSTPPYHSLVWQTACEGARLWKHLQASGSILKHLEARCKFPCPCPLFCSQLACGTVTQREWLGEPTVLT